MQKTIKEKVVKVSSGGTDAFYCLGLFGAFYYFLHNAHSFTEVVVGIAKSFVWPAFLVYSLLQYLRV